MLNNDLLLGGRPPTGIDLERAHRYHFTVVVFSDRFKYTALF